MVVFVDRISRYKALPGEDKSLTSKPMAVPTNEGSDSLWWRAKSFLNAVEYAVLAGRYPLLAAMLLCLRARGQHGG